MESESFSKIQLPLWDELPNFGLHIDQLLKVTNTFLKPIIDIPVTRTMIQNYFKNGILDRPNHKYYERKQIGGAIVVGLLKNIFTLNELKEALRWILSENKAKEGYNYFIRMFNYQIQKPNLHNQKGSYNFNIILPNKTVILENYAVKSILYWLFAKRLLNKKS